MNNSAKIAQAIERRFFNFLPTMDIDLNSWNGNECFIILNNDCKCCSSKSRDIEQLLTQYKYKYEDRQDKIIKVVADYMRPKITDKMACALNNEPYIQDNLLRADATFLATLNVIFKSSDIYEISDVMSYDSKNVNAIIRIANGMTNKNIKTLIDAISIIGHSDGLKYVYPMVHFLNIFKIDNEYFPILGRKLWLYVLTSSIICSHLHHINGLNRFKGFLLGLSNGIGKIAIYHEFVNSYDKIITDIINDIKTRPDNRLHDALMSLKPDGQIIIDLITIHADDISTRVLDFFNFDFGFNILNDLRQETDNTPIEQRTESSLILTQSMALTKYKFLDSLDLIEEHYKDEFLKHYRISRNEAEELLDQTVTKLNINSIKQGGVL